MLSLMVVSVCSNALLVIMFAAQERKRKDYLDLQHRQVELAQENLDLLRQNAALRLRLQEKEDYSYDGSVGIY